MYAVSAAFRAAILAGNPQYARLVFSDGLVLDDNLLSFDFSEMVCADKELTIGSTPKSTLEGTLLNDDGALSGISFGGAEFTACLGVEVDGIIEYAPLGVFICEQPDSLTSSAITIVSYDRMVKFDVDVSEWWANLPWSNGLDQRYLFFALCAHCGVPAKDCDILNGDKTFYAAPILDNELTGTEILSWIAAAACSFARMTRDGQCELAWFTDTGIAVDADNYWDYACAEYEVAPVDELQVAVTDSSIDVIVGTGDNCYRMIDNPMMYGVTIADVEPYARNIYNRLASFPAFAPVTLSALCDWSLQAGDIITIQVGDDEQLVDADGLDLIDANDRNLTVGSGESIRVPIYRQTISYNGVATALYENSGSAVRPVLSKSNRTIIRQNYSTHEVKETLTEFERRLSTVTVDLPVYSATAPTEPTSGMLWWDTTNGVMKRWSGSAWQIVISADFNQSTTPTATAAGQYWCNTSTGLVYKSTAAGTAYWVLQTGYTTTKESWFDMVAGEMTLGVSRDNILTQLNMSPESLTIKSGLIFMNGWGITANGSLYYGGSEASPNLYLGTRDLAAYNSVCGYSKMDWRFKVGSNFGVDSSGYLYANQLYLSNYARIHAYSSGAVLRASGELVLSASNVNFAADASGDVFLTRMNVSSSGLYIYNTIYSQLPTLAVSYTANVRQDTDYPYSWYRPTSSEKYKRNIEDIPDDMVIDTLLGFRARQWNTLVDDIPEKQFGAIAEEVYKVNPLFTSYEMLDGELEMREVHYQQFISLLIRGWQLHEARLEALETKFEALRKGEAYGA